MKEGSIRNTSITEDLHSFVSQVHDYFDLESKPLKWKLSKLGNRSLSQNALQHVMYGEISKYLISKGRQDCNPEWVKMMLKNSFLGWRSETFTDVKTGEKVQRDQLVKTSSLDKGEALEYTQNIINWARDIGLEIKIPENSDYMKHMREQNE